MLLFVGALVAVALLMKRGEATPVPLPAKNPNAPANNTAKDIITGVGVGTSVVGAATPVVSMIAGAFANTAVVAAPTTAVAVESGTALATAADAAAEVAATAAAAVVAVVMVVVVWVAIAVLLFVELFNALGHKPTPNEIDNDFRDWFKGQVGNIEYDLLQQIVEKLGGKITAEWQEVHRWGGGPVHRITSISGISLEKQAAALCIARYAAIEQMRAHSVARFNGEQLAQFRMMAAVTTGGIGGAFTGSKFQAQRTPEQQAAYDSAAAHRVDVFEECVAQYYRDNNPTSFGLAVTGNTQAPRLDRFTGQMVARAQARTWADDDRLLAGRGVKEYNHFVGTVAAIRSLFFRGDTAALFRPDNIHNTTYAQAAAQALGVDNNPEWSIQEVDPIGAYFVQNYESFLVCKSAGVAFRPQVVIETGQMKVWLVDPKTGFVVNDFYAGNRN